MLALASCSALGVSRREAGDGDAPTRATRRRRGAPRPAARCRAPTPGQDALGPLAVGVDLADTDDAGDGCRFKQPPRGGLLVNLDTGEVLWRRNPERTLPIASLTKMMTALVAVDALRAARQGADHARRCSPTAGRASACCRATSACGRDAAHGLMLPSGNDAARALAFRAAGSIDGDRAADERAAPARWA